MGLCVIQCAFDRLDTDTATRFEMEFSNKLEENKYFETLQTFLAKQTLALDTVAYSTEDSNANKTDNSKHIFIHQSSNKMPTRSTFVAKTLILNCLAKFAKRITSYITAPPF